MNIIHGSDVSVPVELALSTVQQLRQMSRDTVAPLCRAASPLYDVIRRLPVTTTHVRTPLSSATYSVVAIQRRLLAVGDVIVNC